MALLFPDPQRWLVEIAFGAAPDGDPDEWTWTDVSADLKTIDGIAGFNGRSDEQSRARPFQWVFALDNTTGKYTPDHPTSPFYPKVRLGTPCRLTPLLEDGGSGDVPLDAGFIAEWTPQWPEGDLADAGVTAADVVDADPENDSSMGGDDPGYARVHVVVSGPLRRLGQGNPPIGSAIARSVSMQDVEFRAYWPFEEQSRTSVIRSGVADQDDGTIDPDVSFGAVSLWAGSLPLPLIRPGAGDFSLPVSSFPRSTIPQPSDPGWRVDALFTIDQQPDSEITIWLENNEGDNTRIGVTPDDEFFVEEVRAATGVVFERELAAFDPADVYGQPLRLSVVHDPGGVEDIDVTLTVFRVPAFGEPVQVAQATYAQIQIVVNLVDISREKTQDDAGASIAVGHVTVTVPHTSDPFALQAIQGFLTERAGQRFIRLCEEEGVSFEVLGDPDRTVSMGPQTPTTFVDNLNQVEEADGGIVFGTRVVPGMGYRTFIDLLNQGPAVTLDASPHDRQPDIETPYVPVLDDRDARNQVTVSRPDGADVQVQDADDIRERGLYPETMSLNVASDDLSLDRAAFEVTRGTWPGMRVRAIVPAITQRYELARLWHEMFQGDLIRVENLPPQHPPGDVELLLRGRTARFDPLNWDETGNTSAAGPYRVGIAGGVGGVGDLGTRYDSSRSYLVSDIDDSQTSIDVYVPVQRPQQRNSDFETNEFGSWQGGSGVTLELSQVRAFRGEGSVKVTPEAGVTSEIRSTSEFVRGVPALADIVHQFSAWVFSETGGFDVALRYSALIEDGISTGTPVTLPAGEWVHLFAEQSSGTSQISSGDRVVVGVIYDDDDEMAPMWVDDLEAGLRGVEWVDDAAFPGEFPFDVVIGGERMRVTAATVPDASRVQTLTVTRGLDGVTVARRAGESVRLADPLYFANDPR
jgi:hypothetical protein